MARYIDADKLKERMLNYYECVNSNTSKEAYKGETLMNYEVADMIEDCIDNAPTAEVAEVRHGKWVAADVIEDDWILYKCNLCDTDTGSYYKEKFRLPRYCPHCGARMEGDADDKVR